MISTAIFIMVCASAACYAALMWWLWRGYRRACALRVCHHCGHQLTKFAGGRMPWCPECGGLSGPRTRWRFVRKELRRPRVIGVGVLMVMGFVFAGALGPGVSWARGAGALGTGTTLWLCEFGGGPWREGLVDSLCVQDGLSPLTMGERKKLAGMILADARAMGLRSISQGRERALSRFAVGGVLTAAEAEMYDGLVDQATAVPKWPFHARPWVGVDAGSKASTGLPSPSIPPPDSRLIESVLVQNGEIAGNTLHDPAAAAKVPVKKPLPPKPAESSTSEPKVTW